MSYVKYRQARRRTAKWRAFKILFCCSSESDCEGDKQYTTKACQCKIDDGLEATCEEENSHILLQSKAHLDITILKENNFSPLSDAFKTSLGKLDCLITSLSNIHEVYKCNKYQPESSTVLLPKKMSQDDIFKFNVNINNTNIECHTKKAKHSLKIIEDGILHAEPSKESMDRAVNTEGMEQKIVQKTKATHTHLQRSYHTLTNHFGKYSTQLLDQISSLSNDIKYLKNVFYSVECVFNRDDKAKVSQRRGDMKDNSCAGEETSLEKTDECKFIAAKIRAVNFCKFYKLGKKPSGKKSLGKNSLKRNEAKIGVNICD